MTLLVRSKRRLWGLVLADNDNSEPRINRPVRPRRVGGRLERHVNVHLLQWHGYGSLVHKGMIDLLSYADEEGRTT